MVPMIEIGSVSPVITVERHELRNRKTMIVASSAPSISIDCTDSKLSSTGTALSRMIWKVMPS